MCKAGKQIAVAMTEKDEATFLSFLRSMSDIQIFHVHAPSPELFLIESFPPRNSGHKNFIIWNKSYPWTPEFVQSSQERWHLKNYLSGPVIEYERDSLSFFDFSSHGRIFWPKCPDTASILRDATAIYVYDHKKFGRWYDQIVRWIHTHGRLRARRRFPRFYLPNAYRGYGWFSI